MSGAVREINHRVLMRDVEEVVDAVGRSADVRATVHTALEQITRRFCDQLGIDGGRLYEREEDEYVLRATFGRAKAVEEGLRVSRVYKPLELVLQRGVVFMRGDEPGVDPTLEEALGVDEFAAVELGDEQFVLGLNLAPGSHRSEVLLSLGIVRHAVNQKIRHERTEDVFRQVGLIQASILPRHPPRFAPYDIAGRNESVEGAGGDLFDFIPITDKIIGLAIADATGHGLPAALQVRDIYTGLRMGLARDYKIVRTLERLNRIINASTLTSRFVSMFYGELERTGTFIYVNAGHPAPLHVSAQGEVTLLDQGGPVLGPLPDATFDRGFVHMRPGDLIVAFTDGLSEATGQGVHRGEEYGTERLLDAARRAQGGSAEQVVEALFGDIETWTGGAPAIDDRTLMVVTYPG